MSANNYLSIEKIDDNYWIKECDAENYCCSLIEKYGTLKEACQEAEKYQREYEVEYGIRFNIEED